MLERLDEIDWSALSHAYGPADDVPGMLRALGSRNPDERAEAMHEAFGNIFHQGTRYPATAKAIPFLIELAAQKNAPSLPELLDLLSHCVAGSFSSTYGPVTGSGPIWGDPPKPMEDYGETRALLAECEAAAEPAVPLCLNLLIHGGPKVALHALHVLAGLHAFSGRNGVAALLRDRYGQDSSPSVRAMLAFALIHLTPRGEEASLAKLFAAEADPLVRVTLAMGCARRSAATAEMANVLVGALSDPTLAKRYEALPIQDTGLVGDVGGLLPLLGRELLQSALPKLLELLRTADDFDSVGVLGAALTATFGEEKATNTLTPPQRELLETLVENPSFWMIGNALSLLSDRDLPSMRETMAAALGVQIQDDPLVAARLHARAMRHFGPNEALESWKKVAALVPGDQEALLQMGRIFVHLDDPDSALPLLQEAAQGSPQEGALFGEGVFMLGVLHAQREEWEEALAAFERAQPHLDEDARSLARQNRGMALQRLGRFEEAFQIHCETEQQTAAEFYSHGLAAVKAGRYAECIASITRVLEEEPTHANAHYTLACAQALSGQKDAALGSIARAIELEPELAESIAQDSDFEALQGDPRFTALVGTQE